MSRTTLLAHPMPKAVGLVGGSITAANDEAYRKLIADFVAFYPTALNNERWGEQVWFGPDNAVGLAMTFLDTTSAEAEATWAPLLGPLRKDARFKLAVGVREMPFGHLWDAAFWAKNDPSFVVLDRRPGEPGSHYWWAGNQGEVSAFWCAYQSRWLPLAMFTKTPDALVTMLFDASRIRRLTLHINKGLSGATAAARARDVQTSLHPGAFDAAALIIVAASQANVYPGLPRHEPDLVRGRVARDAVERTMRVVRDALPGQGAYANEADYFTRDWKEEFWGANYERLRQIKRTVDRDNLFRVHHGVGSDE